jgi:hypothetical protein
MKFITSTHLNQWADTKECQQLLPELIKRLIDASVSNVDRISFPSGDTVYLPGWDGVVSCDERIDMVSAGVSLWECGATKDVKGKIDGDYDKRTETPLGYDKSDSTFVFVTPRIWEGAEEWVNDHQNEWKKVVVYTAVELERWIENRPSVGMWLAEKRRILLSEGYKLPDTFWEKWAHGKDYTLPYEIMLPGREDVSKQVVDTCKVAGSLVLNALTQSEGIAFAIASILTCEDAEKLKARMIVVTEKNAYEDLTEHYDNLILLTTVTEGINYSTNRGHSVIVASTPADQIKVAINLPIIEKEGFVKALVKMGIDEAKARVIAKDTARDVNVLRRREKIELDKPKWADPNTLADLLPAFLIGKWLDNKEGDKTALATLSGMDFDQYELKLKALLLEEETPLLHFGNMWRIRSPFESIDYAQTMLTTSILNKFREVCRELIQDDDPEAIDRAYTGDFQFRQFEQKYSNTIKEGVYQSLCLLSIVDDSNDKKLEFWVDETVKDLLKDWNLSRFLSNKRYMTELAEASPKEFLSFLEKLPKDILDVVFTPRQPKYSLFGWEISYTEVLFSLEMLAWDVDYLNRVTNLLLQYSEYKNESNFSNNPVNSLYNIFRVFMPQTYATYKERMTILNACASKNQNIVYEICKRICESLNGCVLDTNQCYRWRLFGELRSSKYVDRVSVEQLNDVVALMLQCCDYSPKAITDLIALSTHVSMGDVRMLVLGKVREHLSGLDDVQIVVDALRKDINHHLSYPDTNWSLSEMELKPYQDLLDEIEPKDVMHKNAWLFEEFYVQLPREGDWDYDKEVQRLGEARNKVVVEIVDSMGRDGIWEFLKIVKCPESVSESLVAVFGDSLLDEVCQKYQADELSENFTRSFLNVLCYNDIAKYQELAAQIIAKDPNLTIVLYAPRYIEGLAKIAADCGEETKRCYWESVNVGPVKDNVDNVVRELIKANRYSQAITTMHYSRKSLQMEDLEIVKILYSYLMKSATARSQLDIHYIVSFLKDLDKSEDPEVIRILIFVEFLLYRVLEHERINMSNTRFVKELSRNPELMMQLVELASVPDDGIEEQLEGVAAANRKTLGECAIHIMLFGRNMVSFIDGKGTLNEQFMNQYIDQLYKLAKERKRLKIIDSVVGNILGDIPRDKNYPPKALCELVERLGSDKVDLHIRIRLNSRGMHFCGGGGNQERAMVSELEKYKEKTKLLYPRMTRIFEDLINENRRMAVQMDNESRIDDLEY